jgi:hypothetical protein
VLPSIEAFATMGKAGKQSDRNAKKNPKVEDTEPATAVSASELMERAKALFVGTCLATNAMELKDLLTAPEVAANGHTNGHSNGHSEKLKETTEDNEEKQEEKKEEDKTEGEKGENGNVAKDDGSGATKKTGDAAKDLFSTISVQLNLFNPLGFAEPGDAESSKSAWLEIKEQELDFGPRAKKRGTPAADRILENVHNNMPQYIHVLLALMCLRAFLFRSWFACLPWLLFYQFASVFVPLTGIPQLPQVPIDQCPVKFRAAGTMAIHALVWFFFALEFVWRMWFFEKFLVLGIVAYHAYAVRPFGK